MKSVFRIPFSLVQKIMEKMNSVKSKEAMVLMFHQVNDNKETWINADCAITEQSFAKLISSIDDFRDIRNAIPNKRLEHGTYITFDDAFGDVFSMVFPYLKEKRIPFIVFVSFSLLDTENYLSTDELLKLASWPFCTIGAHTVNHKMLRWLTNREAYYEIDESRVLLEKLLCKKIELFAYPYGSIYACSNRNRNMVKNDGFSMAFSTLNSYVPCDSDRFFIPRINVNENNYEKIKGSMNGIN